MHHKRGVELSLNTVIIAVMALLVLAVVVFILFKNVGPFGTKTACPRAGGHCVSSTDDAYTTCAEIQEDTDDPDNMGCRGTDKCCKLVGG